MKRVNEVGFYHLKKRESWEFSRAPVWVFLGLLGFFFFLLFVSCQSFNK